MKLIVNGEAQNIDTGLNVTALLEQQGFGEMLVAVARNGTFVPKNMYDAIALKNGDTIEIVSPMQGG